jgi:ubiquitin carboxyl-terminal hydrolase 5/13
MTCGALGCSRKNYDGTGGNGHAVGHFETTGHPLVCKMGTITPEGQADLYCYACDDSRLDEQLATHLATFGLNVADQTKTTKSMAELVRVHLGSSSAGVFTYLSLMYPHRSFSIVNVPV